MSLDTRIKKLEQRQDLKGSTAIIYVEDDETNEEAYRRTYPEDSKQPKAVVYLDSIDKRS
jgi:hypothetical protein